MEIKSQGVSSEKGSDTFPFWKRNYCTKFLSYDMRGFNLSMKVLCILSVA